MDASRSIQPVLIRFAVFLTAIVLLIGPPVSAYTLRPYTIHAYTTDDGLPSSWAFGVTQGADGRIWVTTRNDVAAYDGHSWQCWSTGADLPRRRLHSIHCDGAGAIWVVQRRYQRPLSRWDGERWIHLEGPAEQRPESCSVTCLAVDGPGTDRQVVAAGTAETGLWLLGPERNWRQVGPAHGLPGLHVRAVEATAAGFLVATEGGLARVSTDGSVDLSLNLLIPEEARDLSALSFEPAGGGENGGHERTWVLSRHQLGWIEADTYHEVCDGFTIDASRAYSPLLLPLPSGAVIFGNQLTLLYCDHLRGVLEPIGRSHGLINEGATGICLDREGNIWIAGLRGVNKLVPAPFASLRAFDGMLEDEVTAVCEPWPGTILLGHSGGLTFLDDSGMSTLPFMPAPDVPESRRRILDLAPDGTGNCWIADNALGLVRLSRDRKVIRFGPEQGMRRYVTSVLVQPSGEVIASAADGLYMGRGGRFERMSWPDGDPPRVRRLFSGPGGTLYLATFEEGVWVADGDRVTRIPGIDNDDDRRVVALLMDEDGSGWVGTWGGLRRLKDGRIGPPEPPLDQVSKPVFFIIRDHRDRLWFGTNDGVMRWDGVSLDAYGVRDGLAGRETNRAAGFVDSRGRIWMGTETGLSLFLGDQVSMRAPPPLTAIHRLTAGDEPVGPGEDAEVAHQRNTLVFEFGAISLSDELAVRYQYFLEGFEEEWLGSVPAATRRARYTNLPPGRYRLHLRAVGAPGVWSEEVVSPWITILKPFWLRWWFFLLVAAAIAQVAYWGVAAVSRKHYARRLSAEVAARTAELEESRSHYRLLFHGAAVPKMILDVEDGVVLDANLAADDLCGFPPGTGPGQRPAEGGPAWLADMLDLCRNSGVGEEELQVAGRQPVAGGDPRDVEAWGARLVLGGRQCVLVTAMDITSRRRLEVEQLRASKLDSLGVLAGGIAHDFNNMLTTIMGNLSLAQEEVSPSSELGRLVASATTASRNASRLTSQLLTFARGGAPVRRTADIGKLIRESTTLVMSGSSCTCEFDVDPDLWPAEVDAGQLGQLVGNLVINACQAMPEGGQITIRAHNVAPGEGSATVPAGGPRVRITVADEGHGIPPQILAKVFDPYFSTKEKGSGLGLATAYAIARGHNGTLTVQSSPGKGALFTLIIPATPGVTVSEGNADAPARHGLGRVLVMDDEEQILDFYDRALTKLGYRVVAVTDGNDALERFRSSLGGGDVFNAVIMDLTIPGGMGGREAVRLLRELDPSVKVVVASGYSTDPVLANPEDYGFSAVLTKPFNLQDLASVLDAVINDSGAPPRR